MDKVTLNRIETIHPLLRQELRCIYQEICETITTPYAIFRFSHVLRSFFEQDKLYAQGRTAPGTIVTNAQGGESFHNYGLAVDIVQLLDKDKNGTFETASWNTLLDADKDGIADWLECVKIFESYGWRWGLFNKNGVRYDLPHFQKTFGYTIGQLKLMPKDPQGYPIFKNISVSVPY
ncbi:MAG TPA: M15 family metallopeptidase [Dysgonamonadaceae bacterium]|nr:M15 family metallopeptidase [Dysgonamonadaceae bacterium]